MKPLRILAGLALLAAPLVLLTDAPARKRPRPPVAACCGQSGSASPAAPEGEILWDAYGVPHIFAKDDASLLYAYGWAQMQAHGDLILRLYGQARGRAAEYWGVDDLEGDQAVWRAGIPARSKDWLRQQSPVAARLLDAFVRGMNDYAARHRETLDPQRRLVLPVTPVDVLAHTQRVLYLLFVAEEEAQRARAAFEKEGPTRAAAGAHAGSNAWAISPRRSASGQALLLANPHLPWGDFFTWFEAHLSAPGVEVTGASLVGQSVLGIAFNRDLGWTHTVNTIDAADTYELTLAEGGYRYDGEVRPFQIATHRLQVKQEDGSLREELLEVKGSVHGPVIAEKPGRALALRVAGLDQPGLVDQYWRMIRARNLDEFQEDLRLLQMPMFTVLYADRGGHILHLFGGRTPRRPAGDYDWSGTLPGDTSKTLWTATHGYDELPRALDPESGWLQNANDPPWTTTFPLAFDPRHFPPYMAPRGMGFRPQRSARMLSEHPSFTWEDLLASKHSTRMELADRLLDDLAAAVRAHGDPAARRGLEVLEKWDRTADNGSRGGVLFAQWTSLLPREESRLFAKPWSEKRPRDTPDGLASPQAAAAALGEAVARVQKDFGAADVAWGEVHRLRRDSVDLPANGGDGELGIFRVTDYAKADDGRFVARGGDSYVAVVEFGMPLRAATLVGYGNWSQRGSRHRTDQLELYSRKELKPAWLTRAEVEAHLERREAFGLGRP